MTLDVNTTYSSMLDNIIHNGVKIQTRNSIVRRLTGLQAEFTSTPLVSVRKTAWKSALLEMEWFLSGSSNIKDLDLKVHSWWKPWTNASGEIPNNYGKQFRRASAGELTHDGPEVTEVDQIKLLIDGIKANPYSRRNVITTWNTADMVNPLTSITNCHGTAIQTFVNPDRTLDILMFQRSADMVLGLPHNWIQYWAFLLYLANETYLQPGKFTWIGGDCHVYEPHIALAHEIAHTKAELPPTLVFAGNRGEPFKASSFILDDIYKPVIIKSVEMVV